MELIITVKWWKYGMEQNGNKHTRCDKSFVYNKFIKQQHMRNKKPKPQSTLVKRAVKDWRKTEDDVFILLEFSFLRHS